MHWLVMPPPVLAWACVALGGVAMAVSVTALVLAYRSAADLRKLLALAFTLSLLSAGFGLGRVMLRAAISPTPTVAEMQRKKREAHYDTLPIAAWSLIGAMPAWVLASVTLVRWRRDERDEAQRDAPAASDRRSRLGYGLPVLAGLNGVVIAALLLKAVSSTGGLPIDPRDPLWSALIAAEPVNEGEVDPATGLRDMRSCSWLASTPNDKIERRQNTYRQHPGTHPGWPSFEPTPSSTINEVERARVACGHAQLELVLQVPDPRLQRAGLQGIQLPWCGVSLSAEDRARAERAMARLPEVDMSRFCGCWGPPRFGIIDPEHYGSCIGRDGTPPWERTEAQRSFEQKIKAERRNLAEAPSGTR